MVSRFRFTNHAAIVFEVISHFIPKLWRHHAVNGKRDSLRQEPRLKQNRIYDAGVGLFDGLLGVRPGQIACLVRWVTQVSSRVASLKCFGQSIRADLRVAHSGLNPNVPHQRFYDFDSCSVVVQVCCKRTSKRMGSDILYSGAKSDLSYHFLYGHLRKWTSPLRPG